MGPRAALRRSASEESIPSQDDSTPREAASVPGRRARAVYPGGLAALSVCAAFLPLADHLGYEFAELIALFAGLFGATPGIAAARAEVARPAPDALRAVVRGLSRAAGLLLVPVVLILLNGLRRPACEPLAGLVLYALIALPSGILAAALGAACGFAWPRRAGLLAFAVFFVTLAVALWPVARGPQTYAYHH